MVGFNFKEFIKENEGSRIRYKFRMFKHEMKCAWQRAFRGYDDIELWNLDKVFVERYIEILNKWLENVNSHPATITYEEWKSVLLEMKTLLEEINEEFNSCKMEDWPMLQEKKDRFFKLFSENFYHLWD